MPLNDQGTPMIDATSLLNNPALLQQMMGNLGYDKMLQVMLGQSFDPSLAGTPQAQGMLGQAEQGLGQTMQGIHEAAQGAQGRADTSAQTYQKAAAQPMPQLPPEAGLTSLFGNLATAATGKPMYAGQAQERLSQERQQLMETRAQRLESLEREYTNRAEVARQMGQLDLSLEYEQQANKVAAARSTVASLITGSPVAKREVLEKVIGGATGERIAQIAGGARVGSAQILAGSQDLRTWTTNFGNLIGSGMSPDQALQQIGPPPAGVGTTPPGGGPKKPSITPTTTGIPNVKEMSTFTDKIAALNEKYKDKKDVPALKNELLATRHPGGPIAYLRYMSQFLKPGNPIFPWAGKPIFTPQELQQNYKSLYSEKERAEADSTVARGK